MSLMNTVSKVRITSSVKVDDVIFSAVKRAAQQLKELEPHMDIEIVSRKKKTIKELFKTEETPVIVVSHQLPILYFSPSEKIVYHENTMRLKVKQYEQTGVLPTLIHVINQQVEEPKTIIDCTMGMANDLMLLALMYPDTQLYACEQHPLLFYVISEGILQFYDESVISNIHFYYGSALNIDIEAADVIYMDPMFEQSINQTSGVHILAQHIDDDAAELVEGMAGKGTVSILKAHYRSSLFELYDFKVDVRKTSSHQYGIKKSRSI